MFQFNEVLDLQKAMQSYENDSRERLVSELCYWKDMYNVERLQATWLDALADHLRDTSDEECREYEGECYQEYQDAKRKLNSKWY